MLDYLGRVADDGAEEFLFGNLFEVREAEFGKEFLFALELTLYILRSRRDVYLVVAQVSF